MTIERYRELFGDKVNCLTDEQIQQQIAYDRQFIRQFIALAVKRNLTLPSKGEHHGN